MAQPLQLNGHGRRGGSQCWWLDPIRASLGDLATARWSSRTLAPQGRRVRGLRPHALPGGAERTSSARRLPERRPCCSTAAPQPVRLRLVEVSGANDQPTMRVLRRFARDRRPSRPAPAGERGFVADGLCCEPIVERLLRYQPLAAAEGDNDAADGRQEFASSVSAQSRGLHPQDPPGGLGHRALAVRRPCACGISEQSRVRESDLRGSGVANGVRLAHRRGAPVELVRRAGDPRAVGGLTRARAPPAR